MAESNGHATPLTRILPNADAVAQAALVLLQQLIASRVSETGRATIALAGGSTPLRLYERLAAADAHTLLPWSSLTLLYGDERCVPWSDPRSNHGAVSRVLLEPLAQHGVRPAEVLAVPELSAELASRAYEQLLRSSMTVASPGEASESASPQNASPIDVVLLGVGADGHTASLFPHSAGLEEQTRWVVPVSAPTFPNVPISRVTLTMSLIRRSRHVILLATGAEKAGALGQAAATADDAPNALPIARARGREATWWLLDEASGAELSGRTR